MPYQWISKFPMLTATFCTKRERYRSEFRIQAIISRAAVRDLRGYACQVSDPYLSPTSSVAVSGDSFYVEALVLAGAVCFLVVTLMIFVGAAGRTKANGIGWKRTSRIGPLPSACLTRRFYQGGLPPLQQSHAY
ncbi:MAG: hypothetical protein CMO80_22465 [Verrucomicrobiales bacterium]|nr:hypothetical protein [Verrucomicrobiales bacterium]